MDFNEFRYKVSQMSPLKRAFVSAALGAGAFGVTVGVGMVAPALTPIASIGLSLLGSIMVSSYSDHTRGSFNIMGAQISKDSLLNVGVFFGSYAFAAPKLLGAALGFVLSAGHATTAGQAQNVAPPSQTIAPPSVS